MKTVGFIGTGGMGSGMAANLIKAGYHVVVTDLRREQARALEDLGADFKESPKAVAESCELVLSMLPHNDAVRAVGGSIAAEHGVGTTRAGFLPWTRSDTEIGLMRRLKAALDPTGILNPGKVLLPE